MTKEQFYDKKIAPELRKLAVLAESKGLNFLAFVEWEQNEIGRTAFMAHNPSQTMKSCNELGINGFIAFALTKGVK